jgi:tripartite-type tricarboxylate transporter receptor subunit TctC
LARELAVHEIQRRALLILAFGFAFISCALTSHAADYPERPLRLIVPFAAGGGTDLQARLIAREVKLGQLVIVENRPGGGSTIGSAEVAKAKPDGYTLLMASFPHTVNPSLMTSLPYDTRKDFAPITLVSTLPLVLVVHNSIPATSVRELIAYAKARPGAVNYGSSGIGGPSHIAGELFKSMAGIDMLHIDYKGAGDFMAPLLSGELKVSFVSPFIVVPHVKSGVLRALAVTSADRLASFPELPTIADAGGLAGFQVVSWNGVLAPAGTPADVIRKLQTEIVRALASANVRKVFDDAGSIVVGNSPAEFSKFIDDELRKYGELVKSAGIRLPQ